MRLGIRRSILGEIGNMSLHFWASPIARKRLGVRFPLVVLSHGGGSGAGQLAYLAESLASHGYVVAAPDHSTNDISVRAAELATVVESVLTRGEDPTDKLHNLIDTEAIAIGGGSRGTATAATALQQESIEVDALLLLEATTMARNRQRVSEDVPVLHIGGGDVLTEAVFPLLSTSNFYGLDIGTANDEARAHHWQFGVNGCQFRDKVLEAGLAVGASESEILASVQPDSSWLGCAPGLIPIDEVQQRVTSQSLAFLDATLKTATGLDEVLSPALNGAHGDLWISLTLNASSRERLTGLLTRADGLQMGIDPTTGERADDFNGDVSSSANRPRSSLNWRVPQELLVAGEFTLTAVAASLQAPREYSVYQGVVEREDDVVFSQLLTTHGILTPGGAIEPYRFNLVPEPDPNALTLLILSSLSLHSRRPSRES